MTDLLDIQKYLRPSKIKPDHVCAEPTGCHCSISATEPDETCPVHGGVRSWPPKCGECGRFMKAPPDPVWNPPAWVLEQLKNWESPYYSESTGKWMAITDAPEIDHYSQRTLEDPDGSQI